MSGIQSEEVRFLFEEFGLVYEEFKDVLAQILEVSVESHGDTLFDNKTAALSMDQRRFLKSTMLKNMDFKDKVPGTDFIVKDKEDHERSCIFSDRFSTRGELRGKVLREYLLELKSKEPEMSMYDAINRIIRDPERSDFYSYFEPILRGNVRAKYDDVREDVHNCLISLKQFAGQLIKENRLNEYNEVQIKKMVKHIFRSVEQKKRALDQAEVVQILDSIVHPSREIIGAEEESAKQSVFVDEEPEVVHSSGSDAVSSQPQEVMEAPLSSVEEDQKQDEGFFRSGWKVLVGGVLCIGAAALSIFTFGLSIPAALGIGLAVGLLGYGFIKAVEAEDLVSSQSEVMLDGESVVHDREDSHSKMSEMLRTEEKQEKRESVTEDTEDTKKMIQLFLEELKQFNSHILLSPGPNFRHQNDPVAHLESQLNDIFLDGIEDQTVAKQQKQLFQIYQKMKREVSELPMNPDVFFNNYVLRQLDRDDIRDHIQKEIKTGVARIEPQAFCSKEEELAELHSLNDQIQLLLR